MKRYFDFTDRSNRPVLATTSAAAHWNLEEWVRFQRKTKPIAIVATAMPAVRLPVITKQRRLAQRAVGPAGAALDTLGQNVDR